MAPETVTSEGEAVLSKALRRMGGVLEVSEQDPKVSREALIDIVKAAVARRLGAQIIDGDGSGANLYGLVGQVTDSQTHCLAAAGNMGVPALEDWDLLLSLVLASGNWLGSRADALLAPEIIVRHLEKLLRAAGVTPEYRHDPLLGVPILHYSGVPVYSAPVTLSEAAGEGTSVWALKLRGPTGVKIVHLGGKSSDYGIVVEERAPTDAAKSRRAWLVGGTYGVLVPEKESIARMRRVQTAAATLGVKERVAP